MMKNFTLNDDQFEELAKERHCACTNAVKPGCPTAKARSTADRFYHEFEPNSILRFFTYNDITMHGAFRFFFSLAKPAAVG
jgi:hypothetical protein